ncbi:MAG: sigma 54-interacting transcriptional regulator [Proteobacteria bacterium]|nr:sigma 54-interacting transcriptional regulator [Pseudomonadota bacterium]
MTPRNDLPESERERPIDREPRELRELRLLFEVGEILDRSPDLRDVIEPVLEALALHRGLMRGTITLIDPATGEIAIEAAYGLSAGQRERGRYKLGEGITGQVVQTGRAVVVPSLSEASGFLDRTGARRRLRKEDVSFVCVPIKIGKEVIGALSADCAASEGALDQHNERLLSTVAAMIAQAARVRQAAQQERQRLLEENRRLQEELKTRFRPANIIGNARAMQPVYDMIAWVSPSDTTVMIRGESGVGKELIANAIHYNSERSSRPLVKVNCAALPESVLESELFGHEAGAFTGALRQRRGRFELAHSGTIFLDEIGDLPPTTQVLLLRVLQEREFERVGGASTIRVDVRIVTATNRNLEALLAAGKFREDLYYRLNVVPIHVPPLRERKTDIPLLADFFVERYSKSMKKPIRRISTPAIDMLTSYHWPGNVRELENCIERAVLLSDDSVIHGHHLPPTLQTQDATNTAPKGTLLEALEALERELLVEALKRCRGNMAQAARELDITERVMGLRVRKFGVDWRRFRAGA